jgi:hypothetical protein
MVCSSTLRKRAAALVTSSRFHQRGRWRRLVVRLAAGLAAVALYTLRVSSGTAAQEPRAGRIVGHIDGIRLDGGQFQISGWACQQGIAESIGVHIYADHSAYDAPKGTLVVAAMANLASEPAVNQACQDREGAHRFQVDLPDRILSTYEGRKLFVHGIRKVEGVPNAALDGSGALQFPYPSLSGAYTSSAAHPRVFTTQADLDDLVTRINSPGSFSAQSFETLAGQVKKDLAAPIDWDATYSGCDLDVYLHAFSYEPTSGYADEIRTPDQLRSAMNVAAGASPPTGAAIVASRSALYAALIKAGANGPAGGPSADQAVALARRILVAWANRGFRDPKGNFLNSATQFCDGQGQFNHLSENGVGLQIGRGVIYSVHAQDLLQSFKALDAAEAAKLNAFHAAMFDLIREASNFRFTLPELNHPDNMCDLYSNHVGAHLIGLLAIARLLDDGRKFNAVLYGGDRSIPLAIPWTKYFNHAIYGESDRPIACYKNSGADSLMSHSSYQTAIVAPGEIEDRYRHATAAQAFGYPLGVLGGLYDDAEIMKNAGIDAYGYRGARKQSIEMATEYYACFGKSAGFKKMVTADNARACPDYQEYIGQIVNDVETAVVAGAYRFPGNAAISELDAAAKAELLRDPVETLRFGRWGD